MSLLFKGSMLLLLVFLVGAAFYLIDTPKSAPEKNISQNNIVTVDCWFVPPLERDVECGHFYSQFYPSKNLRAEAIQFVLPFVIIRDHSKNHRDHPLVYLSGGPGSSNFIDAGNIGQWYHWLDDAQPGRDLVLMDQRGTGLSQPQFRCGAYENYLRESLQQNFSLEEENQALLNTVFACVQTFLENSFSFEQFSSAKSVGDLQYLMEALDYSSWNVMGASYGTRVAMEWSQIEGEGVRAMVLDSVYPPGKGGLLQWPETLNNSFQQAWASCQQLPDCHFNKQQMDWALEYLKDNPVKVTVSLWNGGWPLDVVVNNHRFLFIAYSSLYRASGLNKLSQAIDEMKEGNSDTLKALVEASVNSDLDPSFNPFTYFLVDCAENYRPQQREYDLARENFPLFSEYTRLDVRKDVCQLIPPIENFEEFADLETDEHPVLFLSGQLDPVTPARWVEQIRELYPNGQSWLLPTISHGITANSNCVLRSVRQYLDDPTQVFDNPCLLPDSSAK